MKTYYRDPHRLLELVKKCFAEEMTFEVCAEDIWRHSARGNHIDAHHSVYFSTSVVLEQTFLE